ncbi:unnamed protein product [Lactuca saligna]|uniref:Uncharacterized protein n=1 Tax=Lactuca saligna TaxID=75948 RepID=A0AA35Z5E0_LACSI|nr:unnamed protein product [Lactuca saligna]
MMENVEKQQAEWLKIHAENFEYEIKKLRAVAKERHEIFVDQLEKSHYVPHGKVDIVADAISNIKESVLQASLSNQSSVSQEASTHMISSIEANLKKELAPILELVLILLTNAPPAKQVPQGGEKGCRGVGSSKVVDKGAVVGKVISTQISTSLPVSLITTFTTTTTRPILKGIVIGESVGGLVSSSKPPPSKESQGDKGKGVKITLSEEEKKKKLKMEIERQTQINSILRQRQNDPPGLHKGDPNKL